MKLLCSNGDKNKDLSYSTVWLMMAEMGQTKLTNLTPTCFNLTTIFKCQEKVTMSWGWFLAMPRSKQIYIDNSRAIVTQWSTYTWWYLSSYISKHNILIKQNIKFKKN